MVSMRNKKIIIKYSLLSRVLILPSSLPKIKCIKGESSMGVRCRWKNLPHGVKYSQIFSYRMTMKL